MRSIRVDASTLKCKCGSTEVNISAHSKQKRGNLGYGKTYYDVEMNISCAKCGEVLKREGNNNG
jgi:hypothetical protein